jgi:hypothetical protein
MLASEERRDEVPGNAWAVRAKNSSDENRDALSLGMLLWLSVKDHLG